MENKPFEPSHEKTPFKAGENVAKEVNKESDSAQQKWEKVREKIENYADSLGYRIDEGIKETVVALNAFEINTCQSCEGHADRGMSAPWVSIKAPNEPEERFIGENKAFEKVAKKYNISFEEAKRCHNVDAYKEAEKEFLNNGETEEFGKWNEKSEKLLYVVKEMLDDFYRDRQVPENLRINVDSKGVEDMPEGNFRIFSGGDDYRKINDIKLSEKEKELLNKRLEGYRGEMQTFAEFLKDKFFNQGEIYINAKRSKVQEEIDQDKINKTMETLKATETENYAKENLKDFESVEIKKISELPYWNKISKFLGDKKITDGEVIVINDEKRWRSIYGSNDSKSYHKPKAIILKKKIFDDENISDENASWLIHEIGHVEFYKNLGDKLDEYMEEYHKKGEYANSGMEKAAFNLQFEYLKSIGKTKAECLDFIEKHFDRSFGGYKKGAREKELEQVKKYISSVF